MPTIDVKRLNKLSAALKVLAHPTRLLIVNLLAKNKEPQSVTDIYTNLGLSQAIASQHLITLKDRGVLDSHKQGTKIYYTIASDLSQTVAELIIKHASDGK